MISLPLPFLATMADVFNKQNLDEFPLIYVAACKTALRILTAPTVFNTVHEVAAILSVRLELVSCILLTGFPGQV